MDSNSGSADRRNYSSGGGYRGSRRSNNYRGGVPRGGRRGGGDRRFNHGGGGRGGNFNNNNYGNNNGPPSRRSGPGNRFAANDHHHNGNNDVDPQQQLLNNLLGMLHKVGELKGAVEDDNDNANYDNTATNMESGADTAETPAVVVGATGSTLSVSRPIIKKIADNIHKLALFVKAKPETFLRHNVGGATAVDKAGPLAAGLVHCVVNWPLHTSTYSSLVLALDTFASQGFAQRTVKYAGQLFGSDMDRLLLSGSDNNNSSSSSSNSVLSAQDSVRTVLRLKLLLRFFTLLARDGVLKTTPTDDYDDITAGIDTAETKSKGVSLVELYTILFDAAQRALDTQQFNVAKLLVYLIYCNMPYIRGLSELRSFLDLYEPLRQSLFMPGVGPYAILLKQEQVEDIGGEDQDDDDDLDEDDDDGPICDTFQALHQTIDQLLYGVAANTATTTTTHWTVLIDAPYLELKQPAAAETMQAENNEGDNAGLPPISEPTVSDEMETLKFIGKPLLANVFEYCNALLILLDKPHKGGLQLVNRKDLLDGVVVGRLPIYGPPPDAALDGDEDDDDEEEVKQNLPERLKSYQTNYTMADRYFVNEAVRDCLASHESVVTDAGVDQGSSKSVAEDIWSISMLLTVPGGKGIEFAILESMLSLLLQSGLSASSLQLVYISRVLLELTKLEPMIISSALAIAMSTLFQDYLPALVPNARYKLSNWFAFHLINTDYQWPSSYWKHWEPFVQYGWLNSRGAFVKSVLSIMVDNVCSPDIVIQDALPRDSLLAKHLVDPVSGPLASSDDTSTVKMMTKAIENRIWGNNEDPDLLLSYIIEEEISEQTATEFNEIGSDARKYWRVFVVVQALLAPARAEQNRLYQIVEQTISASDDSMNQTDCASIDILSVLTDTLQNYSKLIMGVLAKDCEGADSASLDVGKLFILRLVNKGVSFSRTMLVTCVDALLELSLCEPTTVLEWCTTNVANGNLACVCWWEAAGSALTFATRTCVEEMSSGMEVQDDENKVSSEKLINTAVSLVEFTLVRVCKTLSESQTHNNNTNGTKLTALQTELVEGSKYFVCHAHSLLLSMLTSQGSGLSVANATAMLQSSKLEGSKLAGVAYKWEYNTAVRQLIHRLEKV